MATHVLLPEMMLPRRTDAVTVIAASAEATRQRLGLPRLEPWSFACRASHGKILADGGG